MNTRSLAPSALILLGAGVTLPALLATAPSVGPSRAPAASPEAIPACPSRPAAACLAAPVGTGNDPAQAVALVLPAPWLDAAARALIPPGGVLIELTRAGTPRPEGPIQPEPILRGWVLPDGRWHGPALAPGDYTVLARARGRAVSAPERLTVRAGAGAAALPLDLRERAALRVRVRDRETGQPLLAARVEVWPADAASGARPLTLRGGVLQADDLPPGRWTLRAAAEGYLAPALQVIELGSVEETVELALVPGAFAVGVVHGAQGPLPGARVCAGGEEDQALVSAVSDAAGRFCLGPLESGPHALRVEAIGHAPLFVRGWRVEPGRSTPPLTLRLVPGAAVSGEVLDPDGRPSPGARVSALISGPGGLQALREADCDAQGRFQLGSLPPGPLRLLARAPGCASPGPLALELPPAGLPGLRLTLVRGGALATQVVDERGRPVAGATFELSGWEGPVARATSDVDGLLQLSGLPPTPLVARLSGPDTSWLASERSCAPERPAPARWVLRRAARLEGRVRMDPDAPPREGTVVELIGLGLLLTLPVDPTGAWQAEGLEPGEYTVRARLFEVGTSAPVTVGLTAGASLQVEDLLLPDVRPAE